MVSFNPDLHSPMQKAKQAKETLMLVDCKVSAQSGTSSSDSNLEVVANAYTHVQQAPTKMKVTLPDNITELDPDSIGEVVTLHDLDELDFTQPIHLTISIKVLQVDPPTTIQPQDGSKQLTKQECIAADSSKSMRLVL